MGTDGDDGTGFSDGIDGIIGWLDDHQDSRSSSVLR